MAPPYLCFKCRKTILHRNCRCNDCRMIKYCSVDCQRADIEFHRPICAMIRVLYDYLKDEDNIVIDENDENEQPPPLTLPPPAVPLPAQSVIPINDSDDSDYDDMPELESSHIVG